jgi:DNA-binding NarL/FixJ family response regulator
MNKSIKVAIADDHAIFRLGLKHLLSKTGVMDTVVEAASGCELLSKLTVEKCDVILLDIQMPKMDGVDTAKILLDKHPLIPVIVITNFSDRLHFDTMLELGVRGFILKSADVKEFENAIFSVYSGGVYFSLEVLGFLTKKGKEQNKPFDIGKLTRREHEVLKLICNGCNNNLISEKMFISVRTVEKHKTNIFIKTGVDSTQKLIIFAVKNNLFSIKGFVAK